MRLALLTCLAAAAALALFVLTDLNQISAWAINAQRGFQNQMAMAVQSLKSGNPGAYLALLSATGAYGFVHALGPGHGKYLVGGIGVGTQISTARLLGLAIASSLAQSLWAIALVYGGFFLIEASAHQMTALAEDFLAPASYLAIAAVGLTLVWRGMRSMRKSGHASHHHHDADCDTRCHSFGSQHRHSALHGRNLFVGHRLADGYPLGRSARSPRYGVWYGHADQPCRCFKRRGQKRSRRLFQFANLVAGLPSGIASFCRGVDRPH